MDYGVAGQYKMCCTETPNRINVSFQRCPQFKIIFINNSHKSWTYQAKKKRQGLIFYLKNSSNRFFSTALESGLKLINSNHRNICVSNIIWAACALIWFMPEVTQFPDFKSCKTFNGKLLPISTGRPSTGCDWTGVEWARGAPLKVTQHFDERGVDCDHNWRDFFSWTGLIKLSDSKKTNWTGNELKFYHHLFHAHS